MGNKLVNWKLEVFTIVPCCRFCKIVKSKIILGQINVGVLRPSIGKDIQVLNVPAHKAISVELLMSWYTFDQNPTEKGNVYIDNKQNWSNLVNFADLFADSSTLI